MILYMHFMNLCLIHRTLLKQGNLQKTRLILMLQRYEQILFGSNIIKAPFTRSKPV